MPVAKVKFDREDSPPDWNYERDQEPDIIFMAYTVNYEKDREKREILIQDLISKMPYSSYDEAVNVQKKFLENKGRFL